MKQTTMSATLQAALANKQTQESSKPQSAVIASKPDPLRVAAVTDAAQSIFSAICEAADGAENMWQMIVTASASGYTWDEMEAIALCDADGKPITTDADGVTLTGRNGKERALRLPDLTAYRQAKKRIRALHEHGVSLFDADGAPVSSTVAAKLLRKPKGEGKGEEGDSATTSNPAANAVYTFSDSVSLVKAALAVLLNEPTMRKAFRDEIPAVARALANDEANLAPADKPGTLRVSPRRAKLAAAAARAAQAEKPVAPVEQSAPIARAA